MEHAEKPGSKEQAKDCGKSPIPSISLLRGGGAIRGIGEKFGVNPVTGTGSISVPQEGRQPRHPRGRLDSFNIIHLNKYVIHSAAMDVSLD